MPRKPKIPTEWDETVAEKRKSGPRAPRSDYGSLADRCKAFKDEDGDPLGRDELLGLIRYRAEVDEAENKDSRMRKFMDAYNCNPNKDMKFESYCYQAEISPDELFSLIYGEYARLNRQAALAELSGGHARVMAKTIEFAQAADNVKDREMVHKMNEMPGLAAGGININNTVNNNFAVAGVPRFDESAAVDMDILEATTPRGALPAADLDDMIEAALMKEEAIEVER